jgi:hypothetical protein
MEMREDFVPNLRAFVIVWMVNDVDFEYRR